MTSYTVLTDEELDSGKPVTPAKMKALRDNPLALAEGDPTAPRHGQGFITGRVEISSGVLAFSSVNPSIDGIGASATVGYDAPTKTANVNLNVDWSAAGKGIITTQTTYIKNTVIGPFAPEFLMNRNVIGVNTVSVLFTTCYDSSGNSRDDFQYEFLITYDRSIDLPV